MTWLILAILSAGGIYVWIEVAWDGTSHWFMGVTGAVAFLICRPFIGLPYVVMAPLMATVIVILELFSGMLINRDYSVWDYRDKPYNIMGHICLQYYLIWMAAMPPLIIGLDWLLCSQRQI